MMGSISRKIDWQLLAPILVLIFISLTTLFSINATFFRNQLFFVIISFVLFLFFSQSDIEIWENYSKQIYIVSLVGLLFLLFLGYESHGAVRWLSVFGFTVQFSEIFKPFLAICLASFLTVHKKRSFTDFIKIIAFLAPIAFLIFRQPDLGSSLMYVLATFTTLLLYGFPLWWFGAMLGAVVASIPLLFRFLHGYQRDRILSFLHLTNDPLGTSYNAIQAIIAVGSGMVIGRGLGLGTQSGLRFLPERHTDFIFATLSEDLGFLGALIIVVAFCFLFYRLYVLFQQAQRVDEKVFIGATFSLLFVQFFVNIGMNIGVLPIVGVPLPFVSYGGSSLLSNAIFLGLVCSIGGRLQGKSVLEIT